MALYDGFFDATFNEETQEYDRNYGPADFTDYFANVIGSGVCVHNNPDSFKAEYEDGTLYLRPGYLFIRGYWLANKPEEGETDYKGYAVTIPAGMTGSMAVVAHLNLGQRLIEIEVRAVSQAYPDALVLAIITTDTAEDTRHNTDICGVIDTAGELSWKVEWAVNYIDTEIESKFKQIEADIAAQNARLDAKISEVQAVADSIVPPPVGSIKFSASQNVGEEWLRCDGSFISESQYPELVAALGKLTPSGDKFQLISSGEIGPQISNGVIYDGRMWVYSYSTKKLYGIDVEGTEAVKEITLSSEDAKFQNFISPSTQNPIALSIVPQKIGDEGARIFLAQILAEDIVYPNNQGVDIFENFVFFYGDFQQTASEIELSIPFHALEGFQNFDTAPNFCVPYVISKIINGEEVYYFIWGEGASTSKFPNLYVSSWKYGSESALWAGTLPASAPKDQYNSENTDFWGQRVSFNPKNAVDVVSVADYYDGARINYSVYSKPVGTFDYVTSGKKNFQTHNVPRTSHVPLNIVGSDKIVSCIDTAIIPWVSYKSDKIGFSNPGISLPSAARVFVDAGAYLWGKDIYMIFVGTGIIFSRTLEEGSFGYLDTTSVLGTITQFGYLDYSQDEGTLYLLGQDTTNTVKAAKIVLNTLYDYANDGAWLPMIASDGVPAYIKAKEDETSGPTVPMSVKVVNSYSEDVDVYFNGEKLIVGTYTRNVSENGKFTIGIKAGHNLNRFGLKLNGSIAIPGDQSTSLRTAEFNVNDYISNGAELTVYI